MSRGYGRGSIVSFIVVGVLLVALVLGGLYVVKNQFGDWFSGQNSNEVAREANDETAEDDSAHHQDDSTAEDERSTPATDGPDDKSVTPDQSADSDAAPTSDDAGDDSAVAEDDDDATSVPTAGVSGVASEDGEESMPTTGVELPKTGLSDSLFASLPLVALAAAVVAYRRSNML